MRTFFLAHFLLLASFCSHFGEGNKAGGNNVLPVHVYAGDDALLPCVVHLDGNNGSKDDEAEGGSVLWRRRTELLTAGIRRVSSDKRYGILHDAGGDVWVLVIRKATVEDAGLYVCETNVAPVTRSFHKLSVLNRTSTSAPKATSAQAETSATQVANHSDCCISRNVSFRCLPLCALLPKQLSVLPSDLPQRCAVHVPDIVGCVADEPSGADNGQQRKCCAHRVPAGCASWCAGRPPAGDSLKARLSCAAHAVTALTCAVDLIRDPLGPSPQVEGRPRSVEAQAVSARALNVSWQHPEGLRTAEAYVITARLLAAFDDDVILSTNNTQEGSRAGKTAERENLHLETEGDKTVYGDNSTLTVTVPGTSSSVILRDLQPFSMYEIQVASRSSRGDVSESSDSVRAITLPPPTSNSEPSSSSAASAPPPDAVQCCSKTGLNDHTCLKRLCAGTNTVWVTAVEANACSRWAPIALPCLLKTGGGINETACCQMRGVPQSCLPACALHKPSTLPLDFVYDRCAAHVSDVWACAVRKRRQLPSAPRRLRAPLLRPSFALLRWSAPAARRETVRAYALRWRPLSRAAANATATNKKQRAGDKEGGRRRTSATAMHSRHDAIIDYRVERVLSGGAWVLERLEPGQRYEVFVQAVNTWGASEASSRLIFATPSREWLEASVNASAAVSSVAPTNASSACCAAAGLPSACLPLCAFDVSLEAATALAASCASHLHTLLRCGANGREHGPCCARRGVAASCLRACAGVLEGTATSVTNSCAHFIGDILQCFEEGAGLLPGPVEQLVAERVTDSSVLLRWRESSEGGSPSAEQFVVHYQKENASAPPPSPLLTRLSNHVNVTERSLELRGLATGALYRFFVVAQNQHGSSLPSSILMLNVTHTGLLPSGLAAVPSPPHSLAVAAHSATWLSICWQPPLFSLPSQRLSYKLFHKATSASQWEEARTGVPAHTLQNLLPNAQYIAYVVAEGGEGTSLPSETLVAWTDPAYPAFVEPPTVHPASLVTEGGTMTVLCIAMGAPTPTISLYVAGRLVRQEETRHMVTVVHNVTRDMETVACYADNGYGTPMQAARRVAISYPPHVTAPDMTWASRGESVALECRVWARPEPQMVFWRDAAGRVPVVQGGRFDISVLPDSEEEWAFSMRLTVRRASDEDAGQYFCRADNALGDATKAISLRVRAQAVTSGANLSACCVERNVSVACLDACSFTLDLSGAAARAECADDLPALVRCAADGADHRGCCAMRGVPQHCSEWCAGRPLAGMERCALLHATAMADCFSAGSDRLPGPPRDVRVDGVDAHSARVRWDPPLKNPSAAEMYRVFWREVGSSNPAASSKGDTDALSLRLTGLRTGVRYEAAVKAGNRWGSSPLSRAVRFTTRGAISGEEQLRDVISAAANSESVSWRVGAAVAAAAVATLVAVAATAVWWAKRRRGLSAKSSPGGGGVNKGVSFENPSYLREMRGDCNNQMSGLVDVSGVSSVTSDTPNAFPTPPSDPPAPNQRGAGWVTETLHFPPLSVIPSSHGAQPSPPEAPDNPLPPPKERLSLHKHSVAFKFTK